MLTKWHHSCILYAVVVLLLCRSFGAHLLESPEGGYSTVKVKEGYLRSALVSSDDEVVRFLGVPYAEPPSRFRKATAVSSWKGTRTASNYKQPCLQLSQSPPYHIGSEDCLYLDIYTPTNYTTRDPMPVYVWIFGGSFNFGSSEAYPPTAITTKGVVSVVINYRLGAFGYMAYPGMDSADYNAGITDQQTALKWINRNIHAFGGDASNVTVNGESAGGASAYFHLFLNDLKKSLHLESLSSLFNRMIVESSGSYVSYTCGDYAKASQAWALNQLQCTSLACLQDVPAVEILLTLAQWYPCVDGVTLPGPPVALFESARYAKDVELVWGVNGNEGGLFVGLYLPDPTAPISQQQYLDTANQLLKDVAWLESQYSAPIIAAYQKYSQLHGAWNALSKMMSDFFNCGHYFATTAISGQGGKVFRYIYNHTTTNSPENVYGPTHGMELPFVFNNASLLGLLVPPKFTDEEQLLSELIVQMWFEFASGSLNETQWPPLGDETLVMNADGLNLVKMPAQYSLCSVWVDSYLHTHLPPAFTTSPNSTSQLQQFLFDRKF